MKNLKFYLEKIRDDKIDFEKLIELLYDNDDLSEEKRIAETSNDEDEWVQNFDHYNDLIVDKANELIKTHKLKINKITDVNKILDNGGMDLMPLEPDFQDYDNHHDDYDGWDDEEDYELDEAREHIEQFRKKYGNIYNKLIKMGWYDETLVKLYWKDSPENIKEFLENGCGGVLRKMKDGSIRIKNASTNKFQKVNL